ncbi:DUF6177 family protein [Streptomyces sp. NPDC048514]|uniref:DUF6177 family protein n=1 Tax=Streptomyces sp. NPDC048514 TaxID=3365564 RepID=UPI0037193927
MKLPAEARGAPIERLPRLAESLAATRDLATAISELRAARADLTTPAHCEPPPKGTGPASPPVSPGSHTPRRTWPRPR